MITFTEDVVDRIMADPNWRVEAGELYSKALDSFRFDVYLIADSFAIGVYEDARRTMNAAAFRAFARSWLVRNIEIKRRAQDATGANSE